MESIFLSSLASLMPSRIIRTNTRKIASETNRAIGFIRISIIYFPGRIYFALSCFFLVSKWNSRSFINSCDSLAMESSFFSNFDNLILSKIISTNIRKITIRIKPFAQISIIISSFRFTRFFVNYVKIIVDYIIF